MDQEIRRAVIKWDMKVRRFPHSNAYPWTTYFHILWRKWAGIKYVNGLIYILSRNYYHSEYFKIFDGNEALKFHQSGCSSGFVHGSMVEVPFFSSNNIMARFNLRRRAIKADYLILGKSLHAGKLQYRSIACQKTHQFQHLLWLHCLQSPYSMRSQLLFEMTGSVGQFSLLLRVLT